VGLFEKEKKKRDANLNELESNENLEINND
jgi:hypothetical protein